MALYKAKKSLFELKDPFFGPHKLKTLKQGQYIEITEPNKLPADVKKCLELKSKTTKKKGDN